MSYNIAHYTDTFDKYAIKLLSNLTFDNYILAGHSVTNMITKNKLTGDLDFWIFSIKNFLDVVHEFIKYKYYDIANIYSSMLELIDSSNKYPRINLINTSYETGDQIINRFDFDYCRCYWTPNTGLKYGLGCQTCINTKLIYYPNCVNNIQKRIKKALKYGYSFNDNYLESINYYKNDQLELEDKYHKFLYSDITNVNKTLIELSDQLQKIKNNKTYKELINLKNYDIVVLSDYIKKIIMKNPLTDYSINYRELNIDTDCFYLCNSDENIIMNNSYAQNYDSKSIVECLDEDIEQEEQGEQEEQEKLENITNKIEMKIFKKSKMTKIIQLNKSGSSYITIDFLPDDLELLTYRQFKNMWNLHPPKKHKIIMYEKEVHVSRYSQSYLNTYTNLDHTNHSSYMYSGFDVSNNNQDIPDLFKPYYDYVKSLDQKYNQIIANWYFDQTNYIAQHSDCTLGMIDNHKICIISLYPCYDDSQFRYISFKFKNINDPLYDVLHIRLEQCMILTMHGDIQKEFTHGIDKQDGCDKMSRISLSFRQMSD
jgi:hypothetical protein